MKIKGIPTGEQITAFIMVREANIAKTQAGKSYLNMKLYDGQMEIPAKMWDYEGDAPKPDTVIKVQGKVDEYNGNLQLVISRWRAAEESEYDPNDFIPSYKGDRGILWDNIYAAAESIVDINLKKIVLKLLTHNGEQINNAPAAIYHHHAYLGGLLEHTNSVLQIALSMSANSPDNLDIDLIKAGAILHDIGKIKAYSWQGKIGMTDEGKFMDHIVLGIIMVREVAQDILQDEQFLKLQHIICSHHGKLEWSSPVEPILKEAVIIHHADLLDANLNRIDIGLDQADPGWNKINGFKNPFYKS